MYNYELKRIGQILLNIEDFTHGFKPVGSGGARVLQHSLELLDGCISHIGNVQFKLFHTQIYLDCMDWGFFHILFLFSQCAGVRVFRQITANNA